jgi:rubrerythrin
MPSKEEAVAAAKQLEVDGRRFYLEAAGKASTEPLKKMFASLADDESNHLEWLDKLPPGRSRPAPPGPDKMPGVESARAANKALYGKLKDVFAATAGAKAAEGSGSDIEAIDVAIGMEDKSVEAYAEWVEKGDSEEIRGLGEVLVGQERFHRQLLENAKEYLQNPGDWFMQEEGWNFEGG